MSPALFLSSLTGDTLTSLLLLSLAISICVFFSEDLTIVVVGVLAADGLIPVALALFSIYIGILVADMALYALGAAARTHPRLARYIDHNYIIPFRSWLDRRFGFIILSGHFVPGLRFAAYVSSGFFRFPFFTYLPRALLSGLLLGTTLFTISYWFGHLTSSWLGPARWGVALGTLLVLFFVGRHNIRVYRTGQEALESRDPHKE